MFLVEVGCPINFLHSTWGLYRLFTFPLKDCVKPKVTLQKPDVMHTSETISENVFVYR